jgi:hypothetical protein
MDGHFWPGAGQERAAAEVRRWVPVVQFYTLSYICPELNPDFGESSRAGQLRGERRDQQELFHASGDDAAQVRPINIGPERCSRPRREGRRSQIPCR